MELIIATIINMLVLSSMYMLVALGFAFLFNIMGVLNFSHGVIYMVGGYICYQFAVEYNLNQWLSLFLSVSIIGVFGLFLEKFCFRPLFGDLNRTIVVCIGIIIVLETTVNILVGTSTRSIPAFVPGILKAGPVSLSLERLVTFLIGAVLLAAVLCFVRYTLVGLQMQAVAQNVEGAALQGVNIHRISAVACVIASALAALAGGLMGACLSLTPFMGGQMLLKALELVILGGIGSVGGIFFAGLIVGGLDSTLPLFISGAASEGIQLGVIVLILLFRPKGLFGYESE